MKNIRIKSISLENFKCHDSLHLEFNGASASIYGDNATGKTSIYDALMWLLFSKNSRGDGEKNFEVKPLDEFGNVRDHMAETAVEVVFTVNNEELKLKRTLKEVWTTQRGKSEAVYSGNTSEYYIDDVPCKKYAFSDKVNELVDEDTFKLLTNVSYFADGITWQERRKVLFDIAKVMADEEIMLLATEFHPLLEAKGKLSVDDYKKKLMADKKGFTGLKDDIPARMSECQKTLESISDIDFDGARAKLSKLAAECAVIDEKIASISNNNAIETKNLEIREARVKLANLEAENKAFRAAQGTSTVNTNALKGELLATKSGISRKESALANDKRLLESYDKGIASARARWIAVNGEKFESRECPTCGQKLPPEQQKKAEAAFDVNKKTRLSDLEASANEFKKNKAITEARIKDTEEEIQALYGKVSKLTDEISAAESITVVINDMEGYADTKSAIEDEISVLSGELADLSQSIFDIKSEFIRERSAITSEIANQNAILGKESLIAYSEQRIEQLREEAQKAAAGLETVESMLYLIEEYTRYKTKFIEDSINSKFRIARFRLFREQANGGIEDRCDVVYDGISYSNLNNGARINVGIDITNTLSEAYGFRVPLFIDNAESVTKIEPSDTQIIRLVVSEFDKELRLSYEN